MTTAPLSLPPLPSPHDPALYDATYTEVDALIRLVEAANLVRAQADNGTLFEGYDGREPQREQAADALDALEDATGAAIVALFHINRRATARARLSLS